MEVDNPPEQVTQPNNTCASQNPTPSTSTAENPATSSSTSVSNQPPPPQYNR